MKNSMWDEVKVCHICSITLTSENWLKSCSSRNQYICKGCIKIKSRDYYVKHKEVYVKYYDTHRKEILDKMNSKYKESQLGVMRNGKSMILTGNKRHYPEDNKCELCCTEPAYKIRMSELDYHHWDDTNISKGMWICSKCHRVVEAVETFRKRRLLARQYISLQKIITKNIST